MLKLLISYSHPDRHYVDDFMKHTSLLQDQGIIDRWFDKDICAGDDFWDRIEEHLKDRDIICCFLSANYINSNACKKELQEALQLRTSKGVVVLPIILSPCAWLDLKDVSRILAVPTDGKPISGYDNQDEAWLHIYSELKKIAENISGIKDLSFSEDHITFLEDASLLTKAHGSKNELKMSDIYIHPDLEKKNINGKNTSISFEDLANGFQTGDRIAIVGEDQSGKTTLAKVLVRSLKDKGFIPVYIIDEQSILQGNLSNRIAAAFKEQYQTSDEIDKYDASRIVPIIDDFHKAKNKERVIERLSSYKQLVIIVDTIFDIDLLQEKTIVGFDRYTIKQLKPSLRNALIRKWVNVSEASDYDPEFINSEYMQIDERMSAIDSALGKVLGKNIMPAYPFFILTLLSNYDSINKPLNEEITSQGYCYQALIVLFLAKQGVNNENLDSYINFLTEFAHIRYAHKMPLSQESFIAFYNDYVTEYNLAEKKEILLKKLKASGMLHVSSLGNYDFNYPYLYYFFAGKYFAEHLDDREEENKVPLQELDVILDNLHKNENAYIAIFMVHHSKDKSLIDKILARADQLFKLFPPATMSIDEMAFFRLESTKQAVLSPASSPNEARKEELRRRDIVEEQQKNVDIEDDEEIASELSLELRRSVKTVEVIGRILKNRSGSLKSTQLKEIFEKGMNVHLRLIKSFLVLVEKMIQLPDYCSFIKDRLLEDNPKLKIEAAEEKAEKIFWSINFGFIVGMINVISTSLGSKNNVGISDAVCSEDITPIKFLIKQEISMMHTKNIRLDEIKDIDAINMPQVTKQVLAFYIVHFCKYNRISDQDRQALENFGIKRQLLYPRLNLLEK